MRCFETCSLGPSVVQFTCIRYYPEYSSFVFREFGLGHLSSGAIRSPAPDFDCSLEVAVRSHYFFSKWSFVEMWCDPTAFFGFKSGGRMATFCKWPFVKMWSDPTARCWDFAVLFQGDNQIANGHLLKCGAIRLPASLTFHAFSENSRIEQFRNKLNSQRLEG